MACVQIDAYLRDKSGNHPTVQRARAPVTSSRMVDIDADVDVDNWACFMRTSLLGLLNWALKAHRSRLQASS